MLFVVPNNISEVVYVCQYIDTWSVAFVPYSNPKNEQRAEAKHTNDIDRDSILDAVHPSIEQS